MSYGGSERYYSGTGNLPTMMVRDNEGYDSEG